MRLTKVCAFTAYVATATAFKDASPFFLFSTSELPSSALTPSTAQIQSMGAILESTKDFLSSCPTDAYLVVHQRSVLAQDYQGSRAAPRLRAAISGNNVKHSINVREVVGTTVSDVNELVNALKHCGGEYVDASPESYDRVDKISGSKAAVVEITFSSLPNDPEERAAKLASNDAYLQSILDALPSKRTVIYLTSPSHAVEVLSEHPPYESDFQGPLHVELKRETGYAKRASSNSTVRRNAPLFEKYQFFTPGLFMGITVSLLLLSILTVAITALSSLKVSYGAFDKEMGPAAQKKQ